MSKKTATSASAAAEQQQFPGQHEGEEVRMVFRQHPLVMRKALIGGLLLILLAVLPLAFPQIYNIDWLAGLLLKVVLLVVAVVLAGWFWRWVGWYYTVFIVTDRRILQIKQRGFFDRRVEEWQLDGILNVNYHISGLQAVLFSFGDITARTYLGDLEIKTIHKPAEIHGQLVEAVKRGGGGSMMNGGSTQAGN